MTEGGGRLGFALEAAQGGGVGSHVVGKELQGNVAVKLEVLGLVDHAHAAATDLTQDLVMRDRRAQHGPMPQARMLVRVCTAGQIGVQSLAQ
jgi:hypothetical protein